MRKSHLALAVAGALALAPLAAALLAPRGRAAAAEAPGPAPASAPATAGGTAAPAGQGGPVFAGEPVEQGPIGLRHYLVVSALVFGLGLTIVVVRRNAIAVLMGIELILNSAGLNFVAFSKFVGRDLIDGQVIAVFLIVIAAAEAAVALAIILNIFNNLNTVTVDEADVLKG